METNIAERSSTTTSITVRAWYTGTTRAYKCTFFCEGKEFATDSIDGGSTNWTTKDVTKTGLEPGTRYTFYAMFIDSNGNAVAYTSNLYAYTNSLPLPSTPSDSVTAKRIDGGFDLSWGSSTNATSYDLSYYYKINNIKTGATSKSVSRTSTTLTDLNYGYTYYFSVQGVNSHGFSDYTTENPATVAPKIPTLSSSNITSSSVRINVSGMTGRWNKITIYQYASNGTTLIASGTIYSGGNMYLDFTNLVSGTTYIFKAKSTVTTDQGNSLDSLNLSSGLSVTASSYQRPLNWSWTAAEINAFQNKGPVTTLTYLRWNLFLDKVEAFIDYYNARYGTGVGSVLAYKMNLSNRALTATAFNKIRFSIGSMKPTGISTVYTGDTVYGSYFITLANSLNGIS